jgi:hypothetical protein
MSVIDPLPEDPANAMTLGMALGAALAFARLRQRPTVRAESAEPTTAAPERPLPAGAAL